MQYTARRSRAVDREGGERLDVLAQPEPLEQRADLRHAHLAQLRRR